MGRLLRCSGLDRLHVDRVVPAHEGERRLVVEVAALPADVLVPLGALLGGFLPASAPLRAAGHPPLRLLQRALGLAIVARVRDGVAVRRDEEHLQAHVDAGLVAGLLPVRGSGSAGTSAHEQQTYQPSASRETVTVLMRPSTGRDQRTAIRPIFESTR